MTIGEVIGPVMLPITCGLAVAATVLMLWHVARLYPSAPKRVPLHIGYDGRPGMFAPRALLWLAPLIVAASVAFVSSAALVFAPPRPDQNAIIALVFVIMAETAWLVSWLSDRQVELARKITHRVAPGRIFRAVFPILATTAIIVVVAVHP